MKKSRILVVALSLLLILSTASYAAAGLKVGTSYGVEGDASVSELPQDLSVITCPAGNINTSGSTYNLRPQVVGTVNWGNYMFVAIRNYNVNFSNAAHAGQYNYKTYINVYDMTAAEPFARAAACYNITDLAGKQDKNMMQYMNGIYVDDNNLYVVAADLKAPPYVHIYENPVKTGTASETLTRTSLPLKLMESGTSVVFRNQYKDYIRPVKLNMINSGEKNYLIVNYKSTDIVKNTSFPVISVVDVTDAASPSVAKDIYLSDIAADGITISRYYEMDFDGNYAYVVGVNMGTIDESKLTSDETIPGAYYAMFKLNFTDPENVTVGNAWKLCDIKYKWLADVRTTKTADIKTDLYMVPSLEINDGVVVASLYKTINDSYNLYAQLNGFAQAYIVKSGSETVTPCVPYSFRLDNIPRTFGANIIYANGIYYINLSTVQQGVTVVPNAYAVRTETELMNYSDSFNDELVEIGVESAGQTGYAMLSTNIVAGDKLYSFYQGSDRSDIVVVKTDLSRTKELENASAITSAGKYYATVTAHNTSENTTEMVPVTALYDSTGLIIDCFVGSSISAESGGTAMSELFVTVPESDDYSGYILKTYLFNNLSKITPLCGSMSITDSAAAEGNE